MTADVVSMTTDTCLVSMRSGSLIVAKSGMNLEQYPAIPRKDFTSSAVLVQMPPRMEATLLGSGETPSVKKIDTRFVKLTLRFVQCEATIR